MATSDDEWEYEYDETATDDFYLTLDLTTHIAPAFTRDKRSKAQKTTVRASNKSLDNALGSKDQSLEDGANQDDDDDSTPVERMQIVGLDDKNPIVSYNNAIYSCQWATDVGTNIFIAPPSTEPDAQHSALRSTPSFDVLGTTSARLVAVPATVRPREAASRAPVPEPEPVGGENSYTTAEGDIIQHTETKGLRIELPSTASAARVNQAKFLEALSAIKIRRGDRDAVPVSNIKMYRPPEGWQAERTAFIDKETARAQKEKADMATKLSRQNRRPHYKPADAQSDEDDGSADDAGTNAATPTGTQELDADTPDSEHIVLASQIPRKRRTRGGPRGGAPSGKRLRQSLGLPEARRDKRPRGRPRKNKAALAATNANTNDDAESVSGAVSRQESMDWQADQEGEGERDGTDDVQEGD